MPKYLVEGRYTSDGLKGLAREGSSRRRADIARTIAHPHLQPMGLLPG
jgi:hypothetical protein